MFGSHPLTLFRFLRATRALVVTGLGTAALAGCYSENPENTKLDLDDVTQQIAFLAVEGEGGTTVDFGVVPLNVETQTAVLMVNLGAYTASNIKVSTPSAGIPDAPFGIPGSAFPGTSGTCTDELGEQATCLFLVSVTPTEHGTLSVDSGLEISYLNGLIEFSLALTLKAVTTGEIEITPASPQDFGNVNVGQNADLTLTITNIGGSPVTGVSEDPMQAIGAPFTFKGGTFPGTGGDCAADPVDSELAVGESCTVVVNFEPVAPGAEIASLTLLYNNGLEEASTQFQLSGTGL